MSKTLDVSKIMCERFHLIRLTEQHVQGGAEEMEPLFIRGGPWDRVHPIYALPPAGFTPPSSSSSSLHFLQTETCLIILLAFKPQISCNQICTESLVGWEKAEMLIDSWIHQVPPPPLGPSGPSGHSLEDDLGPEVLLPGGVVVHAHPQHPLGLHPLDVLHVFGFLVEGAWGRGGGGREGDNRIVMTMTIVLLTQKLSSTWSSLVK